MMSMNHKVAVFTDLDGTLLDEDTYSTKNSLLAIKRLKSNHIPIIFCSSKTRKEQEILQTYLDVCDPFIVENGSAIILPNDSEMHDSDKLGGTNGRQTIELGFKFSKIQGIINQIRLENKLQFRTFHDLSVEEVSRIAGLNAKAAELAKEREYSSTITTNLNSYDLNKLKRICNEKELQCSEGGRFYSITRMGADKGNAVKILTGYLNENHTNVITVGIGDSPNDFRMLEEVDYSYLVKRPDDNWVDCNIQNINKIPAIGPCGFSAVVDIIIKGRFS